jgi:hypothetical protein
MNRHERMRRAYFYEEMDRPAVYSRTGYPRGDATYDRLRSYLAEHSEMKVSWHGMKRADEQPVESRVEPLSDEWERHVTVLHTPAGDLTASRRVSLKGQPGLAESWFIETSKDAEKYLSLPEPVFSAETDGFLAARDRVGNAGIVDISLGPCPAGFVARDLCGSQNFALLSICDRDILHTLCQRKMEAALARVDYLISQGVGPFFSSAVEELVAPPLHSPADFDDFVVRYNKPIFDLIHEGGGRVHVHCHGSVRHIMGSFVEMGTDVLHPFEAPPMGDVTPRDAKRLAQGKISLEGNLQIADMYESTPEDIRHQVEELIAACFDDRRGLIVSPTASPWIRGAGAQCFPQYRAMVETVLDYGAPVNL